MLLRLLIFCQTLAFPVLTQAWDEQRVLDMLLASSPVLRAYKVVTREYTPSTPMQRVFEGTSVYARASPSEIGTTQATSDGNFLSSSGSVFGLQISIPLASRKEEREHAVRALNEVKAIEELRGAVLQDLGVLRQHEADYQATEQRIALWSDKSGWAQQRVNAGYDDATGLWDVATKLTEEKANRSKLRLSITSQQHRVAAYAGESWKELLDYLRAGEAPGKGEAVTQSSPRRQKARLPDLSP
jgi:hypothetical protein